MAGRGTRVYRIALFEKKILRQALEKTGGNKTRVAELLKVSYPSLLSKVKEYGLDE